MRYFYEDEEITYESAQMLEDSYIAHVAMSGSGNTPEHLGGGEGPWMLMKPGGRAECKNCNQPIHLVDGHWKHPWNPIGPPKSYLNNCQKVKNYGTRAEPKES